ncbi:hypothetical protein [Nonomuraea sp. NPDC005650]|uniref:hypothetical protein n=1 Tax=Nonomuraea sp. NPDC005650 TaxID=3157045 RepID=UPI0033AF378B
MSFSIHMFLLWARLFVMEGTVTGYLGGCAVTQNAPAMAGNGCGLIRARTSCTSGVDFRLVV